MSPQVCKNLSLQWHLLDCGDYEIVNASVTPSVCPPAHPSACLSICLLNYWAEFNQTCYMTSPHGKGVLEQNYFSVCLSGIYSSHYQSFYHIYLVISLLPLPFLFGYKTEACSSKIIANIWISLVQFSYKMGFLFQKNPKDQDLSYKLDLDLWDCWTGIENPCLITKEI